MSDTLFDPNKVRSIQTRDGVITIPREQKGVPFKEYFQNAELPNDLDRAVVHATPKGPVLTPPDPVPWNEQHNAQADAYADKIKDLIHDKGYYAKTLNIYADKLADETGHPREETKAIIVRAFEIKHGKEPLNYLEDQRAAQGLPVRNREQTAPSQSAEQVKAQAVTNEIQ